MPITPEEIANSGIEAAKAGAAVVHIHVRDPKSGKPSMEPELYKEVVGSIRDDGTDVVINLTCGHGARFNPSEPDANDGTGTSVVRTPDVRMQHVVENKGEFPMLAQAALLGGQVRVGLEDNLYMERGVPAPSNAALVEKGIDILRTLGKESATAQEAREMLGLTKLV